MTGPPAATAAVRLAVRRCLPAGAVTAAVSGGADSLALAAALAFERPGSFAVVVDHGLQPGSHEVASQAAEQCEGLGLIAKILTAGVAGLPRQPSDVWVPPRPDATEPTHRASGRARGGPEAAAREVRYALLDTVDGTVLLGHTKDDQAEQVLLALVRGSGARALSGMPPARGRYLRPLLDLDRATTRAACNEAGLEPWEDPHNSDPSYLRVQVRDLLRGLDLTEGLARSARLLREDADALDALAVPTDDIAVLMAQLPAVRARSLKAWAEQQCGRSLTSAHVDALRALVEDWHGQGPVALPGGGRASRVDGRLAFRL